MAANKITNNGDIVGPLNLPRQNCTVIVQVKLNGLTGLNALVQARINSNAGWITVKLNDPSSGLQVAALTTDGQIGWFENVGYQAVQVTQSGAVAGTGPADVFIEFGTDEAE